jgi:hypothetical protein
MPAAMIVTPGRGDWPSMDTSDYPLKSSRLSVRIEPLDCPVKRHTAQVGSL